MSLSSFNENSSFFSQADSRCFASIAKVVTLFLSRMKFLNFWSFKCSGKDRTLILASTSSLPNINRCTLDSHGRSFLSIQFDHHCPPWDHCYLLSWFPLSGFRPVTQGAQDPRLFLIPCISSPMALYIWPHFQIPHLLKPSAIHCQKWQNPSFFKVSEFFLHFFALKGHCFLCFSSCGFFSPTSHSGIIGVLHYSLIFLIAASRLFCFPPS